MKPSKSLYLSLIAAIAAFATLTSTSEARSCGTPMAPHKRRRYALPHRATGSIFDAESDPFRLVSDIFSLPFYSTDAPMNQVLMRRPKPSFDDDSDWWSPWLVPSDTPVSATLPPRYAVTHDPSAGLVELTMEVPGVTTKDLSVELQDNRWLRISGSREVRQQHQHYGTLIRSDFHQTFQLDDNVDSSQLKVTLSAGILRVTVPKTTEKVIKKKLPILSSPYEDGTAEKIPAGRMTNTDIGAVDQPGETTSRVSAASNEELCNEEEKVKVQGNNASEKEETVVDEDDIIIIDND